MAEVRDKADAGALGKGRRQHLEQRDNTQPATATATSDGENRDTDQRRREQDEIDRYAGDRRWFGRCPVAAQAFAP